jgi:hypothetical protein
MIFSVSLLVEHKTYTKCVQIKVTVMILKTKTFHVTVSTFCNPI